eukprot:scaffold15.g4262.t1
MGATPGAKKGAKQRQPGQKPISSFFFQRDARPAAPNAGQGPPAAKRARTDASGSGAAGGSGAGATPSATLPTRAAPPRQSATEAAATIPGRDPVLHARFQDKLVEGGGVGRRGGGGATAQVEPAPGAKLTPLEAQVAALKKANPGVVLAVEVGYKFKARGSLGRTRRSPGRCCTSSPSQADHNYLVAAVPVPRIHVHVRRLVEAGYRVGVVRQAETAAVKAASANRSGPFERKVAAIYTRATLEASGPAGELAGLQAEAEAAAEAEAEGGGAAGALWSSERLSSYLTCVVEALAAGTAVDLGLVCVEASTGEVLYTQFRDGLLRSELESALRFAAPAELLLVEPLSEPTQRLLACFAGGEAGAGAAAAPPASSRHAASAVRVERVNGAKYAAGGALAAVTAGIAGGAGAGGGLPPASSPPGGSPAGGAARALDAALQLPPLVARALAHALDYLRPLGCDGVLRQGPSFRPLASAAQLGLSANALDQLEVLRSTAGGGERGSLLWLLDRTLTPGGGRALRGWVARPLRERGAIEERLEAVGEMLEEGASHPVLSKVPALLRGLTLDLERSLTRALHRTASPAEFCALLRACAGLHESLGLRADLGSPAAAAAAGAGAPPPLAPVEGLRSGLLARLLAAAGDLRVAAVAKETLACIDEEAAEANDRLRLLVDDEERFGEVARLRRALAAAERALDALLPELARVLGVRQLAFVSLHNQGTHLVEVPVDLVARVPRDWEKVSSTKKAVRYHPPAVKAALQQREVAREQLEGACHSAWRVLLADFGAHYSAFRAAVTALASLDCLNSLAGLAASPGYCRPALVDECEPPQLHIVGGRHPVLDAVMEGRFVPNDTHLQGGDKCVGIVTGPNMGGKSCYIRQAALIAIMAQVGSFVPAESVTMHVFDGIFTRMGASDNLALGRSTFAEELGEASAILAQATPRSLVIMDELGRGTSTRDGVAIAAATLAHLATDLQPLCLFVTHYPEVASLHEQLSAVACHYMSYLEEEESGPAGPAASACATASAHVAEHAEEPAAGGDPASSREPAASDGGDEGPAARALSAEDGGDGGASSSWHGSSALTASAAPPEDPAGPRITFLYKLVEGVAPASFGLNVARMAGLPASVCARAAHQAAAVATAATSVGGAAQHAPEGQPRCSIGGAGASILGRIGELVAGADCAWPAEAVTRLQAEARRALGT